MTRVQNDQFQFDKIEKALGKIADDATNERRERKIQVDKISEAMGKIANALIVIQERQVSEAVLGKIADTFNVSNQIKIRFFTYDVIL